MAWRSKKTKQTVTIQFYLNKKIGANGFLNLY